MQPSSVTAKKPQPVAAPQPIAQRRMSLSAVKSGRLDKPMRVLIYGVEKIGKSTFAADAPDPIFIGAEDGTAQLDVSRFPQPETWTDVLDAIEELRTAKHSFKTAVIDSLDWVEPLLWRYICDRDGKKDIEDYGFGKGYTVALDEWRRLLAKLERLSVERSMHIVLIAHSWIKPFKDPNSDGYDRYELKVHAKAGGLIKEWCDAVFFAQYETFTVKSDRDKRVRGVDSGARVIHTQRRAAWDAGNRYSLPEVMPLSWDEFAAGVRRGQDAERLALEVNNLLQQVDDKTRAAAVEWLGQNGNGKNAQKLEQMTNRLRAVINTNGAPEEEEAQQ